MTVVPADEAVGAGFDSVDSGSRISKVRRSVFAAVMLLTGVASLIHEYVFATVFTYLLGSSIEQFSITIGLMMFAMAIGGFVQKRIDDKYLAEIFVAIELLLVMMGSFAPIVLQWAYAQLGDDFMYVKLIYTVVPGVAIGMEIPLILRINEKYIKNLGTNISETWSFDYIGGALGVIGWLWLLKSGTPIIYISFIVAACNMVVAVLVLVFFWRYKLLQSRLKGILLSVASVIMIMVMIMGFTQVSGWSAAVGQRLYDDPIDAAFTTKYQNIVLTKGDHPTDPYSHNWQLWLNGNKQFSSVDEAIYHEYLVHPAMNLAAQHERILILGGGDGLALREVLKYQSVKNVTLVDLDPGMIEFARDNPVMQELNQNSFSDARVSSNLGNAKLSSGVVDTGRKQDVLVETGEPDKVVCKEARDQSVESTCTTEPPAQKVAEVNIFTIDADRFVATQSGLYDVVIVDLPDPNSIELAKLYSVEFYKGVKKALSPDGVAVVQATSPYHAKETYLSILRSMTAAGLSTVPYHDNVPSFGDWGWILGSPSLPQETLYQRADTLESFGVDTKEIDATNMRRALIFNRGWLTSSNTDVSTLMDPTVYQYYAYEAWKTE